MKKAVLPQLILAELSTAGTAIVQALQYLEQPPPTEDTTHLVTWTSHTLSCTGHCHFCMALSHPCADR